AAGHGALEHRVLHDELADRVEEAGHVDGECGKHAEQGGDIDDVGVYGAQATDHKHAGGCQRNADFDQRHDSAAEEGRVVVGVTVFDVELVEAPAVLTFARHRLDGADAGDALRQVAVKRADA